MFAVSERHEVVIISRRKVSYIVASLCDTLEHITTKPLREEPPLSGYPDANAELGKASTDGLGREVVGGLHNWFKFYLEDCPIADQSEREHQEKQNDRSCEKIDTFLNRDRKGSVESSPFERVHSLESAVNQRGRERKGPPEIVQKFHLRKRPISSADLPMTPIERAEHHFGPFWEKDFGALSGGPLFSRPLCFTADRAFKDRRGSKEPP